MAYQFFAEDSPDLDTFKKVCARGLRCLDLALNVNNAQKSDWRCFRGGLLKSALAEASGLEHFNLVTNAGTKTRIGLSISGIGHRGSQMKIALLCLKCFLSWTGGLLRNFSISHLIIHIDDFISFLAKLLTTIQSLTFIGQEFMSGTWVEALRRLRDELHWRANQFKKSIAVEQGTRPKKVWVEREITDYLARGHNPFTGTFEKNQIQ